MIKELEIMLDLGAVMPTRGHSSDAGLDLYSKLTEGDTIIAPHSSAVFDTGVHVNIPEYYVGFLKSKSGLNVKYNLIGTGVIDAGYTGSIVVKLYNLGDEPVVIKAGNKLIQLVILPVALPSLNEVEEFTKITDSDRGNAGFGSTGR